MPLTKGLSRLQAIVYDYATTGDLVGAKAIIQTTIEEGDKTLAVINQDVDLWPLLNPGERIAANTTAQRLRALAEA